MKIEVGKYYRTRDGRKVGPMERRATGNRFWSAATHLDGYGSFWCEDGAFYYGEEWPVDLVSEWHDEPTSPIRTRREIVPGRYGDVDVFDAHGGKANVSMASCPRTASELREAAHILNQISEVLEDE